MGILARTYDCKLLKPVEPLLKSAMTLAFEVFTLHLLHSHSGRGTNQTLSPHKIDELG